MQNKGWKSFQLIQLVVFLSVSAFLFLRGVDGHGAVQTLDIKVLSFMIWLIFYLGVLIIEWLIYIFVKRE